MKKEGTHHLPLRCRHERDHRGRGTPPFHSPIIQGEAEEEKGHRDSSFDMGLASGDPIIGTDGSVPE